MGYEKPQNRLRFAGAPEQHQQDLNKTCPSQFPKNKAMLVFGGGIYGGQAKSSCVSIRSLPDLAYLFNVLPFWVSCIVPFHQPQVNFWQGADQSRTETPVCVFFAGTPFLWC